MNPNFQLIFIVYYKYFAEAFRDECLIQSFAWV